MLDEMLQDFHDDVVLEYERLRFRYRVGVLPARTLRETLERVRGEFRRLRAVHPGQFPETLFRLAVCRQTACPGLQLVSPAYVLRLAILAVADEYRPKRPALALVA